MSRVCSLCKNVGIIVAVFCAAVAVIAIENDTYADNYTVTATMRYEDGSKCIANNESKEFECEIIAYPEIVKDDSSGNWMDYFCTAFIGYNFAMRDDKYWEGLKEWKPLTVSTSASITDACSWSYPQHYQIGVFDSTKPKGERFSTETATIKFEVSYNDFINGDGIEPKDSGDKIKYSGYMCVKLHMGWVMSGDNGDGYWCTGEQSLEVSKEYVTLTAKAISTTGASLSNVPGLEDQSKTVERGKEALIRRGENDGYKFMGWKNKKDDSGYTGGKSPTYAINSLTRNATVYAVYEPKNDFEGMIRVAEVADAWGNVPESQRSTTEWTKTDGVKIIHEIQNCDPVNGCTVRFWHWLKRNAGEEGTQYSIRRTSNYGTVETKELVSPIMENFTSGSIRNVKNDTLQNKLYPGQVICETLTFKPNAESSSVSITACAFALGKAQPEGPNGESTLLDLKVKNNSVIKYSDPRTEVWAKPGDKLTFSSAYYPVLQYTYNLIPGGIKINGSRVYLGDGSRYLGKDLGVVLSMFNWHRPSSMGSWNNAYYVYSENFRSIEFQKVYKFENGKKTKREGSGYNNNHVVDESEVGLRLKEKAEINYGRDGNKCQSDSCTTPSQVEFTNEGGYNVGNVKTDNIKKVAVAYVPYNFNTGAEVLTEGSKTFFAGEKASVTFGVSVLKRVNNETTDGTEEQAYATRMHNAKVKMIFYYADSAKSGTGSWGTNATDLCSYFGLTNDGQDCGYAKELGNDEDNPLTLEPKANDGANEYSATVNVKDVKAGSKICAAVAVYPSNSGYDKQLASFGSGTWRISDSKCFSIAKKPSFQVWGGSVYSAGKIELRVSAKNNLYGYNSSYPYGMTDSGNNRVFGSWVELGLVANGAVKGLASGAGAGYSRVGAASETNFGGQGVPLGMRGIDLGGSAEGVSTNYCVRSTLSFANNNCGGSSGTVGGLSGTLSNNVASDKSALISEFTDENGADYIIETAKEIGEIKDFAGTVVVNDDGTESLKTTRVIASTGNIKINGDIEYRDSGYTGLGEVPKIIIYSGKNILISCNVNRIDAVLIAENGINTCDGSGDVNDEARSRQLKINGSIISNTLTLGRTYGAAFGAWSIAPAEIINYDTSLYLWSRKLNATTSMDKLVEAYTKELAPRY